MNKFSGVLKVIFVILILVTVGEVGYYLYFQLANKNNLSPSITAEPSQISIANLLPTENPNLFTQNDPNRAINANMVLGLLQSRKGILISSILNNQYTGEIVEIDTKEGTVPVTGSKYKLKLVIKSNQNILQDLYFSNPQQNKIKIIKKTDTGEEPITWSDLEPKDKIIIQSSIDLTKELGSNLIEMKVTKI